MGLNVRATRRLAGHWRVSCAQLGYAVSSTFSSRGFSQCALQLLRRDGRILRQKLTAEQCERRVRHFKLAWIIPQRLDVFCHCVEIAARDGPGPGFPRAQTLEI